MILFLDFDGVLHPSDVYLKSDKRIFLDAEGHSLFEHADWLADQIMLPQHQHVRIVLSTSWVWALSFKQAKGRLPQFLQDRVKGATWHSSQDRYHWNRMTRFEQIDQYVSRHNVKDWVAVDDNDFGWPENQRANLVHTDEWRGLGDELAQWNLLEKLCKAKQS